MWTWQLSRPGLQSILSGNHVRKQSVTVTRVTCLNLSSCTQWAVDGPFLRSQQPLLCVLDYISLPWQCRNEMLISTEQLADCGKLRHPHPPKIQLRNSFQLYAEVFSADFLYFFFFFLPPMWISFSCGEKMTAGEQWCRSCCGLILLFKRPGNTSPLITSQGGDQVVSEQENLKREPVNISGRWYFLCIAFTPAGV